MLKVKIVHMYETVLKDKATMDLDMSNELDALFATNSITKANLIGIDINMLVVPGMAGYIHMFTILWDA